MSYMSPAQKHTRTLLHGDAKHVSADKYSVARIKTDSYIWSSVNEMVRLSASEERSGERWVQVARTVSCLTATGGAASPRLAPLHPSHYELKFKLI